MNMQTEESKGSGASTDQGGASDSVKGSEGSSEETKTVSFKDHKRILDDAMKFKSELKAQRERANNLEAQVQAWNDQKKADEGKTHELLEDMKKRLAAEQEKNQKLVDNFYTSQKMAEVRSLALKNGLRKEAELDLFMLDLKDVEVERTDQGRVLVHGADSFVERLKSDRPHWFSDEKVSTFNPGGARASSNTTPELTEAYMLKLEKTDKAKYREMLPKYVAALEKRRHA